MRRRGAGALSACAEFDNLFHLVHDTRKEGAVSPREKNARLERFEQLCRQHGLSRTAQRRMVFEAVLGRDDHPTADQVHADVQRRFPGVSRTTVYRVLETLVELNVITKACSPGAAARFDPMTQRHHHLVCLHCEKLTDVTDPRLDECMALGDIAAAHSFEVRDFSIHFHGLCAACRRKLGENRAQTSKPSSRAQRSVAKPARQKSPTRRKKA